ncbi:MAG: hypothetical protein HFH62_10930 [Lachnospiraceae bacterium]|nr:hypothetical protein [Lachnospiraceae bacterium]
MQETAREANIYKTAAGLEEAAECVLRFERKVAAYRNAGKKFQSISGYMDSAQRAEQCRQQAEAVERQGMEEAFALGKKKEQEARTKSDFIDAIAEYKRVWKKEQYAREANGRIDACKEAMMRLETRVLWKKRLITLAVLAVLVLIFINTDAYPFAKGMIHQATGDYKLSIANFREGMGVPWAEGKMKKSYLYLGQKYLEEGKQEEALRAFRKAGNTLEAPEEAAKLEQGILAAAEPGQVVRFGKGKWLVLDRKKDWVFMVYQDKGTRMVYSQDEADCWEDTKVYRWLNGTFAFDQLTEAEREISSATAGIGRTGEYATLLTLEEKERYADLMEYGCSDASGGQLDRNEGCGESMVAYRHNWWLKDLGLSSMGASYVDREGTVRQTYINSMTNSVRPVIWVKVKGEKDF